MKEIKKEIRWFIFDCKEFFSKAKRIIWNKGIRLWWFRLWVRKDEFDHSLNIDINAMLEMSDGERERYIKDLMQRRDIAHERELNREKQ